MGYPMTYKRVVKRNALEKGGGYSDAGDHKARTNLGDYATGPGPIEEFYAAMGPHYVEEIKRYESRFKSILGDLRRLEQDAQDEWGIAEPISRRTGIEQDIVAAVLKEFFSI